MRGGPNAENNSTLALEFQSGSFLGIDPAKIKETLEDNSTAISTLEKLKAESALPLIPLDKLLSSPCLSLSRYDFEKMEWLVGLSIA